MIALSVLGIWVVTSLILWPLLALLTWALSRGSTARGCRVAGVMTRALFLSSILFGLALCGWVGDQNLSVLGLVFSVLFLGGAVLNERSWRRALVRDRTEDEPVAGLSRR